MISVDGLTKRYSDVTAVDSLSFDVSEHALFALLGTNGAGKSTTISCMTTLLGFDAGRIRIGDFEIGTEDLRIRHHIGVVFQESVLDPLLSADENLRLRARFYGVPDSRVDALVELVGVGSFRGRRYGVLSGGQKRRVDIARALLNHPRVLFLDEPTAGLDPQSREQIWRVVAQLRAQLGLTVILTTHYMKETEAADHVLILEQGRALVEGTPIELRARYSSTELLILPECGERQAVIAHLERALGQGTWSEEGGAVHALVSHSHQAREILNSLGGERVKEFQVIQGSMEQVFLHLTESELGS